MHAIYVVKSVRVESRYAQHHHLPSLLPCSLHVN